MGRFSLDVVIVNNRDVLTAKAGDRIPDRVKHLQLKGLVDRGAARLVLPQRVVTELQFE